MQEYRNTNRWIEIHPKVQIAKKYRVAGKGIIINGIALSKS